MAIINNLNVIMKKFRGLKTLAKRHGSTRVVVGYTAEYAIYVHENIEMKLKGQPRPKNKGKYWDPQGRGQAKFLEEPARRLQPELGRIIGETVKATGDVALGLKMAGLRLQRESQKLVPVNTGNLKNSAFTRVEK